MNLFAVSGLLTAATNAIFGPYVYVKSQRSRQGLLWFLMSLCVLVWGVGVFGVGSTARPEIARIWWRVGHAGTIFMPVVFIHFVFEFMGLRDKKRFLSLIYIVASIFVTFDILTNRLIYEMRWVFSEFYYDSPPSKLYYAFTAHFLGGVAYAHYVLARGYKEADARQRLQIRYFFTATAVGFLGGSTCLLPVFGCDIYPILNFTVPAYPIIMAYAIVKHQLMQITLVIKKTFIYSLLLLLLIIPCYAVLLYAERLSNAYLKYPVLGCLFVMVAFVFPRIRFRTERSLENILFRRGMNYREILVRFSKEITSLTRLTEVLARTAAAIHEATDSRSALFYLAEGDLYELKHGQRGEGALPNNLPLNHSIPVELEGQHDCLSRAELTSSGQVQGRLAGEEMRSLGAELALPLVFEDRLIGFALLSDRDSAGGYSAEEISFLRTVAAQVAMAIESIRRHQEVGKLKELDALKNALFSKVSHELRTPLTNILLPLQRVLFERGQELHPENRREKEAMLSNGLKLLKRINEILDLSKLQSGKMSLLTSEESLADVVGEVVSAASPAAAAIGVVLAVRARPDLPRIYVNREQMEKVFANVVGNAVKFTQDGGRITVEISEAEEHLVVSVADTGSGIPEADLPFIFDRFRQVDGATSRMYEGTGLGLALVKELVELHRGRIDVESELGKGTTFRVWLPKGREHLSNDEVVDPEEEPSEVEASDRRCGERRKGERRLGDRRKGSREDEQSLRLLDVQLADFRPSTPTEAEQVAENRADDARRRVLVVEDNRDLARNIAAALRARYSVSLAYDGVEGLEVARRVSPDVVVSDVMMPRMDGFELCRAIKSEPGGDAIPVILLTAKAEVDDRIAGFRQGADHYLAKPFNANELTVVIDSLLSRYDLQRELECANTQLQEALQELAEAQVQLVHSARLDSVGELASGVAHEVKNSIYCVRTGLSGLEKRLHRIREGTLTLDSTYPEMVQALQVNSQALERCLFIVNSLLDFSRASRDGMATSDLVKGIENTLAILTPRIADKLEVRTRCDGTLPVECKIEEINQVLMNLVLNAYQAVPERGTVIIDAEEAETSVALRITDDGPGIPEEQLGKIFLPFFTTKEKSGNSGLGLSIAHNIVKAHHGQIEVQSRPGQGTSFTITLPKRQPVAPED